MSLLDLEKKIVIHINNLKSNFKEFENILYNNLLIKDDSYYINIRLKLFQDLFKTIELNKKLLIKEYNELIHKNKINSKVLKYFDKYPDINNPDFNKLISENSIITNYIGINSIKDLSNKIYNTYSNISNDINFKEEEYTIFRLSAIQKVLRNFINPSTPYYGLLIIHGTGVGKTCTSITIAENFKDYVKQNNTKIHVIRPDEFQRQVFEISKLEQGIPEVQCTGETYLEEFSESSDFIDSVKDCKINKNKEQKDKSCKKVNKIINKKINEYYDFKSRILWTKNIINILKAKTKGLTGIKRQRKIIDIIRQNFNNSIIIIDEAHNLRNMDLSTQPNYNTNDNTKAKINDNNTNDNTKAKINDNNTNDNTELYNQLNIIKVLELVLLIAQNVRLVLLSATPMYDRASDIVPLMNLLLLNDYRPRVSSKQLFNDDYGNLIDDIGPRLLNKISRGYISYVKGNDPNNFPLRLYADNVLPISDIFKHSDYPKYDITGQKKISKKQQLKYFTLVNCQLSKQHSNAIINKSELLTTEKEKIYSQSLSEKDLDILTIDTTTDNYKYSVAYSTELQLGNFMYNSPSEVKTDYTSCYGIKGFNSLFAKDKSGSYIPKNDSSLDKFKLSNLNNYGPKIKKILESIKQSTGPVAVYSNFIYGGLIPLIIALELEGYSRYDNAKEFIKYSKKPKTNKFQYVLYTGDKQLSKGGEKYVNLRTNMIKNENVKVFLFSGAGSEGLSLFGYREMHIMEPWHNINLIEQSIGRVIRNKSHHHLDPKYRNVTVYLYTNTFSNDFKDRESIDLRIYSICEQKALAIGNVELLLKSNAFDCIIAKSNNIRNKEYFGDKIMIENSHGKKINVTLEDIEFSRDSSYQKSSDYKCNISTSTSENLDLISTISEYNNITDFKNIYKIELRELKLLTLKILKHIGNISMLDLKDVIIKNLIINPKIKSVLVNKLLSILVNDLKTLSKTSTILNKNNYKCKLIFINNKKLSDLGINNNNSNNIIIRLIPLKNYNKHLTLINQNNTSKLKLSKIRLNNDIMLKDPRTLNKDVNLISLIEEKKNIFKQLQSKEDLNLFDILESIQTNLNYLLLGNKNIIKYNISTNINFNNKLKIGYIELLSSIYDRLQVNEKMFINMYLISNIILNGYSNLKSIEQDLVKVMYYNIVLGNEINFIQKLNKSNTVSSPSNYLYDDIIIKNLKDNIKGFIIVNESSIKFYYINTININHSKITSFTYLKTLFKDDRINLDKVLNSKYKLLSNRTMSKVFGYLVYEKKFQQPKFKITDYLSKGFKKSVKGILCANKQINEIVELNNLLINKHLVNEIKLLRTENNSKHNYCGDCEIFFRLRNNYLKNNFDSRLDYGNIYFFNPEQYYIWQKYNKLK